MTAIPEHSLGVLLVDLPKYGLRAGDSGAVVHVYPSGCAYEVEFFTPEGDTIDVVTVEGDQLRPPYGRRDRSESSPATHIPDSRWRTRRVDG